MRLRSPVLALIGTEDPNTPLEAYLAAVERGLSPARAWGAVVCVLPGRTRHAFTAAVVAAVTGWRVERLAASVGSEGSRASAPPGCIAPVSAGADAVPSGPPS